MRAKLYERIQPYERAGIPEALYDFLVRDEYTRLQMEIALKAEEIEGANQLEQKYLEWQDRIDEQREDRSKTTIDTRWYCFIESIHPRLDPIKTQRELSHVVWRAAKQNCTR